MQYVKYNVDSTRTFRPDCGLGSKLRHAQALGLEPTMIAGGMVCGKYIYTYARTHTNPRI